MCRRAQRAAPGLRDHLLQASPAAVGTQANETCFTETHTPTLNVLRTRFSGDDALFSTPCRASCIVEPHPCWHTGGNDTCPCLCARLRPQSCLGLYSQDGHCPTHSPTRHKGNSLFSATGAEELHSPWISIQDSAGHHQKHFLRDTALAPAGPRTLRELMRARLLRVMSL